MSTKKAIQGGYATEETQKQVLSALGGGNAVDATNTTTATLASGAVFTGTFTDVTTFAQILVTAASDVASAANGLELQYSNDGVTTNFTKFYDVEAGLGSGKPVPSPVRGKFFRVKYTNGGTAQATFTLQTILKADTASGNPLEVEDPLSPKDVLNSVKAVLHASDGATFANIERTGTALKTSDATAQASLASIDTSVDVALSTRASEATLLTIDADTSLLAGTVSGTEQQVDVVAPLPAGTNNIGDVDVASIAGILDTTNSSTALLGSGAVFTGLATDITNIASVVINIFTDQASATDGFSLQFSSDGTNWDEQFNHPITANQADTFVHTPDAQFFRIVYTNGAVAQGVFRLQTCLRSVGVAPISFRVGQNLTDSSLSVVTRAVLSAKKPDLTYTNIDATAGGNLKVSIEQVDAGADLAKETTLSTIATDITTLAGTVAGSEQQVDVITSALPAGASTSVNQATANTSLSSIDGDTTTIAADTTSIDGKTPALGQAASASSVPIVLASDQSDVPVTQGLDTIAVTGTDPFIRNDYSSTNVTTGAYVELIASTANAVKEIEIFDSSGETLKLALGAAASEVDKLLIVPGGNERVPFQMAAGSRLSVRAVSANATTGELIINFYS